MYNYILMLVYNFFSFYFLIINLIYNKKILFCKISIENIKNLIKK